MDKKTTIIIAVVAVVIIAAAAAFVLMNKNSSDDDGYDIGCKLKVYGNVNNDNYLDKKDLSLLNDMIEGKITWSLKEYPFADVDKSGAVDQSDVTILKKFLNGESATMYYMDCQGDAYRVHYPLTEVFENGKYCAFTQFTSGIDMLTILGLEKNIKYLSDGDIKAGKLDETLYPGLNSQIKGANLKLNADDYEIFMSNNVKLVLLDYRWGAADLIEAAAEDYDNYGMNIVNLPLNRGVNDTNWEDTLITLGAMCNLQDKTAKYIKYLEKVDEKIDEALAKAGAKNKTYLMPYFSLGYDPTDTQWLELRNGKNVFGDVIAMEKIPAFKCPLSSAEIEEFDNNGIEPETLVSYQPDVLVVSCYGYAGGDYTLAKYKEDFNNFAKTYRDIGFKGQIVALTFESFGSLPCAGSLLTLASLVWDQFDEDEAWELMYEYYSTFTNFDGSLKDLKNSKYAPLVYEG